MNELATKTENSAAITNMKIIIVSAITHLNNYIFFYQKICR